MLAIERVRWFLLILSGPATPMLATAIEEGRSVGTALIDKVQIPLIAGVSTSGGVYESGGLGVGSSAGVYKG